MSARNDIPALRRDLDQFRAALPGALRRMGGRIFVRIGASATSQFMQDAGPSASPRSPSDSGPLRIVTGRLARSLTGAATQRVGRESIRRIEISGNRMTIAIGTRVPYAGVHEDGFDGPVKVPAHQRTITQAWGRPITPTVVQVKGHERRMKMPKRSYLGPAVRAQTPYIERTARFAIGQALTEALGAGGGVA